MCNVVKASCVVLLVGMLTGCGGDDKGSLGAVEVAASEAVQIRSLLAHIAVPAIAEWSRYSIELGVEDFGNIHGHDVELGDPIDTMCSPEGGRAGAEQVIADSQVVGVIGTLCSASAVTASPLLSAAGLVMVSPANDRAFAHV